MDQYQRDLDIDLDKGFWRGVGYEPSPYHDLPSTEEKLEKVKDQEKKTKKLSASHPLSKRRD